jgi:hypothetical protein
MRDASPTFKSLESFRRDTRLPTQYVDQRRKIFKSRNRPAAGILLRNRKGICFHRCRRDDWDFSGDKALKISYGRFPRIDFSAAWMAEIEGEEG